MITTIWILVRTRAKHLCQIVGYVDLADTDIWFQCNDSIFHISLSILSLFLLRKKNKAVKSTFYIFVENGKIELRSLSFLTVLSGVFALAIGTWYTWYSKLTLGSRKLRNWPPNWRIFPRKYRPSAKNWDYFFLFLDFDPDLRLKLWISGCVIADWNFFIRG